MFGDKNNNNKMGYSMIKFGNRDILWLGALFVFLLDQCTKIWAENFLHFDREFIMNRFISLHRIYNESYVLANYNIYNEELIFSLTHSWQFKFLYIGFALILMIGIIWVTSQPALKEKNWGSEFAKTGLFLILGGILGNGFDRLFREKGVVDFIRINYFQESVPIMNIADILMYVGELCIVLAWLIILIDFTIKKIKKTKCASLD